MSSVLYRITTATVKHAKAVLAAWIVLLLVAVAAMFGLGGKLTNDFTIPGTEGQNGLDVLAERFEEMAGTSGQVVFGAPEDGNIWHYQTQVEGVLDEIESIPHVVTVADPFDDTLMDPIISDDERYAMSQVQFNFSLDTIDDQAVHDLVRIAQQAKDFGLSVYVGGQIMSVTEIPLSPLEAVGVILALIVLAVSFRSLRAAAVPIITALLGVGIAMAIVMIIAAFIPISTTTPTLAIMLGLAVGIDYALFIVSRHRDQLSEGLSVEESIPRAIATSGAAVLFAGTTVVIALVALVVANIPFLTIMGLCAALAVAVAAVMAVTGLPAILALMGDKLRPKVSKRKSSEQSANQRRASSWWVGTVTSHPWVTMVAVTLIVLVMTLPVSGLRLALPDNGVEDESTMPRQTYDLVAEQFGAGANGPLLVIGDIVTSKDPLSMMDHLRAEVLQIPDVQDVQLSTPNPEADLGVIVVIPKGGPESQSTENLVHELRDRAKTWEVEYDFKDVKVTGQAAVAIDVSERLFDALLPFGLVVVGLSLLLLLIVFRSIAVPIKATLGYLFSVCAAFGMTTLVFIHGVGNDALFIGQVGPVISFMPIILMGVLFGLAMDYELFLVSRIAEEYAHNGQAHDAIKKGFNASAPVVVAAALIMMSVFSGFIPGGSFYVQPIAFGLLVGVGVDAFLVRMTLVPAIMQILGKRAWYLPTALDRALPVFDVEGMGMGLRFEHLDWQREHGKVVARAAGVSVGDRKGDLIHDASIAVNPSSIVRLKGDPAAQEALLATLGARLQPYEGYVFVFDVNAADEPSRVVAKTVYLSDRETTIPNLKDPMLFLVNRPLSAKERNQIESNLEAGGALVLGPENTETFTSQQTYCVPSAAEYKVSTR